MSFTDKIKQEIINTNLNKNTNINLHVHIYSIILFNKNNNIFKNKLIFDYICACLNIINQKYTVTQKNKNYIINTNFDINTNNLYKFNKEIVSGAFISCGNISNPNNNYHLEFNINSQELKKILINNLNSCENFNFCPKIIARKNKYVIYIKEHQKITDLLAFIGAQTCAMEFIQIKMLKEIRNNINRTTNFETANLSKITKTSADQIVIIKKIINSGNFEKLPENLKEIAILRLDNPYASINELANMCSEKISKSGVNHRLNKLTKFKI